MQASGLKTLSMVNSHKRLDIQDMQDMVVYTWLFPEVLKALRKLFRPRFQVYLITTKRHLPPDTPITDHKNMFIIHKLLSSSVGDNRVPQPYLE